MRPVHVSIDVPHSRAGVFEYLDVLGNHEHFTSQMLRNWRLEGPRRGVGARAQVDVVMAGRSEPVEIEVIDAQAPIRSVERNRGAGGKRLATGTYTLDELPDGHTRIHFDYAWQQLPLSERLLAPIVRRLMRTALDSTLQQLARQLQTDGPGHQTGNSS